MNTIIIPTAQNIELEYPQAGVGPRILAGIIDIGVLIVYMILMDVMGIKVRLDEDITYTFMVPAMLYSLLCESLFNGQTLGKFILKTRVISLDGASPTFSQYSIRWMMKLVDLWLPPWLVGLVAMSINKKGQRLGDILAGTTVIKLKLVTHFHETIFKDTGEDYQIRFPEIRNLSDRDVSILKEVLDAGLRSSNPELLQRLANKVQQVAGIESDMSPESFLETVLLDYNHLFGRD